MIYTIISKNPKQWIELSGSILLSALVALFLLSGLFSKNSKMILSTLPFILISSNYYYHLYKTKNSKSID
jgi:choline-glycine betaine transporter